VGGKPRKKLERFVWLVREPFRRIVSIHGRPELHDLYPLWYSSGYVSAIDGRWLDVEVPADHPVKVRLRVEVVE